MSMNKFDPARDFKKNPLKREETQIHFDPIADKSMTQQHHNEGGRLDTTAIIAGYFKNGVITHTRDQAGRYIDAVHYQDFAAAMNAQVRADEAFAAVSPDFLADNKIESREAFVEFCLDEKNLDKLRAAGLAPALKGQPSPVEVIIKNPEPPVVSAAGSSP